MSKFEAPRPGTPSARVYELFKQGKGYAEAKAASRLAPRAFHSVAHHLVRTYTNIAMPSKEEMHEAQSEAISLARGGIWIGTRTYAGLRMTASEIMVARSFSGEDVIPEENINRVLPKMRRRGRLAKQSDEEKHDALENSGYGASVEVRQAQRRARVLPWLDAAAVFLMSDAQEWPATRIEWKQAVQEGRNASIVHDNGEHWLALVDLHRRYHSRLSFPWTPGGVAKERAFIAYAKKTDRVFLDTLQEDGRFLLPASQTDRQFLLDYFIKQKKKQQTGSADSLNQLLQSAFDKDPWIIERLSRQMDAIRKKFSA